jgi:CTD small phosphatase-like protein 2
LLFNPNASDATFQTHLRHTHAGVLYATSLGRPAADYLKSRQINLPATKGARNKTLFLDIDETLVHCCLMSHEVPDVVLTAKGKNGETIKIPLQVRPYVHYFLKSLASLFEIFIFTAAAGDYAKAVADYLDPEKKIISAILTRDHTLPTQQGFSIKDLDIVQNRDMKNMVIVDNLVHSFSYQLENGIPILEFRGNSEDRELLHLTSYLAELSQCDDVREFNREKLRLRALASLGQTEL